MRISVGIIAQDEDRDLEITVSQAWGSDPRPYEVIVVDDHSEKPVAGRLASYPDVRCIRHDEPLGCHQARNTLIENAKGDALIILDGHMRMPLDWLHYAGKAMDEHRDALMCPIVRSSLLHSKSVSCGAVLNYIDHGGWVGARSCSAVPKSAQVMPCIMGACYFATMDVWHRMGGHNRAFRCWGYTEQDLALRAWLTGCRVIATPDLIVRHRYGRPKVGNTRVKYSTRHTNLLHLINAFWGITECERINRSIARVHGDRPWKLFLRWRSNSDKEAERFAELRKVSNDKLQELCGYVLPSNDQLREIENQIVEKERQNREQHQKKQKQQEQKREAAQAKGNAA